MATTMDAFNAIAEPKRRRVLEVLGAREWAVNEIVLELGWPQPMVSKHLGVLREVGLVHERRDGRRRMYRLDAQQLKPVHDWAQGFARFWDESLDRLEEYLKQVQAERKKGK